jgi:acetyl-CoA/propionyl-CoA carboxylase, biotin carboxylase, biotin carboxyl carrier protein
MFDTVLVANRGEIAVRVMRTLRRLGVRSVAVYSDADAEALHVRAADMALRIGPAPARESYLSVDAVIAAAVESGARAIHPGYGFLSENPALAAACAEHGIVFVGPPVAAIAAMGDKIAAKATVAAAGVSVVPGSSGAGLDDASLAAAAREVGFPVLLKPSAGGGGKGMRLVDDESGLPGAVESARREARNAFGDDTLLVERFVRNPRHIEIQVLADTHGNVLHLGERECSLQRRHQKIVEEAPSPLLTPEVRASMGQQAVEAARSCGYVGAGTVEFIVSSDRPDEFFFMEMNTRLQVEHPVTEMVYGVDLVEWQLRVAAGEPLPFRQSALQPNGHAVEVRVYAEDPARGFLPTGGRVHALREPSGAGVRVDSGIAAGSVVGSDYDPMLAKVIAWGQDRTEALHRLDHALSDTAVLGFLRRLLADPDVAAGRLDTGLVERRLDELVAVEPPVAALVAVALEPLVRPASGAGDAWSKLVAWRHGRPAATRRELDVAGHGRVVLMVRPVGQHDGRGPWQVTLPDGSTVDATFHDERMGAVRLTLDGHVERLTRLTDGRITYAVAGGAGWTITDVEQRGAGGDTAGTHDGVVRSPMPGTVIAVHVTAGGEVTKGQALAVVEAMKMEHTLHAPFDGTVVEVHAAAGAPVALDAPIVTIIAPSV